MTRRISFDDALDFAISDLRAGRPLEAVVADYPSHARDLRPLLETLSMARADGGARVPSSARLTENYEIVRAAVERARVRRPAPVAARPVSVPWWRRPLTVASLSAPAGVVAILVLTAGGAAGATIAAATTNVEHILPDSVERVVSNHAGGGGNGSRGGAGADPGAVTAAAATTAAEAAATAAKENQPVSVSITGAVSDVLGNTFTLTSADGEWNVNIDATTAVEGVVAEGATALVSGRQTAVKNLHAEQVSVTTPATGAPDNVPGSGQGGTPSSERTPPGQANPTNTPKPADPTKTPKPVEPTNTPRPEHTPPGQSATPPGQAGPPGENQTGGDNGNANGAEDGQP